MKCSYCGEPVILVPSAQERADKDVTGKSAAYYTQLFKSHARCALKARKEAVSELLRRSKENHSVPIHNQNTKHEH